MRGGAWEFRLEMWHAQYEQRNLAHIVHCHPAVKMVGGRLIYSKEGPTDFKGLLAGGRAVAFDAKDVQAAETFPFSRLPGHQAHDLELTHKLGGFAFLAIQWKTLPTVCRWAMIREAYIDWCRGSRAKASITRDDCLVMRDDGWISYATASS